MSGILKIRDKNGNFVDFPAIKGKSAYEYAVEGGYQGTEEEFIAFLNGNLAQPHPVALDDGEEEQEPITELRNKADGVKTVLTLLNEGAVDKADVLKLLFNDGSVCAIYGEHNKPKAEDVGAVPSAIGASDSTMKVDIGNQNLIHDNYDTNVPAMPVEANFTHYITVNANGTVKAVMSIPVESTDKVYYFTANDMSWHGIDDGLNKGRFAAGSYTGTGGHGEKSPNTLTFDFVPKFFVVSVQGNYAAFNAGAFMWISPKSTINFTSNGASDWCVVTGNGNTISWYSTESSSRQLNVGTYTYNYAAWGV